LAEFLWRLPHHHVEGAFDVVRRERLAVVPFDALPQLEIERLAVAAPGPALGEIRDDRIHAVLRHVLLVDDEIVEDGHEGNVGRIGRLLVDRGAARGVTMIHSQDTALLRLGRGCNTGKRQQRQHGGRNRWHAPHASLPPVSASYRADFLGRYHGGGGTQTTASGGEMFPPRNA